MSSHTLDASPLQLEGELRPSDAAELSSLRRALQNAALAEKSGVLTIVVKRLRQLNEVAFSELLDFVRWCARTLPHLKVNFVVSSVIPWAMRRFGHLAALCSAVSVSVYDKAFYPIQGVVEDDGFLAVLRAQQNVVWERERMILAQHGLRKNMRIADICCGIGDISFHLQSEFKPAHVLGVDHSRPFLEYAWHNARVHDLQDIDYQYGDAADLLLPDDSFDFVMCRLSLQIFDRPEAIVKELLRICKPGGRIYITNEIMSSMAVYPHAEEISWTYRRVVEVARQLGVDFNAGLRTRELLAGAGLDDIRVDLIAVNNDRDDSQVQATVVQGWRHIVDQMCQRTEQPKEEAEKILSGLTRHAEVLGEPNGLSSWFIVAGSACKPVKQ
jgi:ubiquinone/menaquinone biosynthesis C-methylase UbiE/ABC-type transporter Mla MlaB component